MTIEKTTEVSESSEIQESTTIWMVILQRLEIIFNVINHMCIGFVTIYMSYFCLSQGLYNGSNLHAWLVTLGFSLLMAEATMSHYNGNVLTLNCKRKTKTTIHWVLQVMGSGLGLGGALHKLLQDDFQMYSTHGRLGFATFILCWISLLTGLFAGFSMRLRRLLSPLLNKGFHNLLGLATFVLALTTQFYGYQIGNFSRTEPANFQILMKCLTLISLVLTCIGPLKALYHKIRSIGA